MAARFSKGRVTDRAAKYFKEVLYAEILRLKRLLNIETLNVFKIVLVAVA